MPSFASFVWFYTSGAAPTYPVSGEVSLFTSGYGSSTSGVDLYIKGMDSASGNFPLYLPSMAPASGEFPLYVSGHQSASGSLNLFTRGLSLGSPSSGVPLTVHGSTGSGIFGGLDLHTYSDASGNIKTSSLNLSLIGPTSSSGASTLNLTTFGALSSKYGEIPLYLCNVGAASGVAFFVRGSGVTAGALPYTSSINLFINRPEGAMVPFFLWSGTAESGNVPLYLQGHLESTSGVWLSVPQVVGRPSGTLPLYSHGY